MISNLHDLETYRSYKKSEHICYDMLRIYCMTENKDYEYERQSHYKRKGSQIPRFIRQVSNITVINT